MTRTGHTPDDMQWYVQKSCGILMPPLFTSIIMQHKLIELHVHVGKRLGRLEL